LKHSHKKIRITEKSRTFTIKVIGLLYFGFVSEMYRQTILDSMAILYLGLISLLSKATILTGEFSMAVVMRAHVRRLKREQEIGSSKQYVPPNITENLAPGRSRESLQLLNLLSARSMIIFFQNSKYAADKWLLERTLISKESATVINCA
jgi:hypothetical protein